ncbi:NADH-cytochrome b5 reductase-like protein [Monoraphidium neglectum]|uniref:cytochrome-b5 reductase n=1 Tax=Monoraphidium neglectum TaxID=145388 RepID=A0A0D2LPC4_9CHLO|nr:NADH-cytochrome b5 reductase-like protein [Monoraphidium neglectum]KIY93599.1 NADH-cytochrome b5 reductase-like protein [Monoraphidium neglectum]|eukprot:XP_013892619.1 NADH-cytochrome b5 reductase-like protein [Monoraphidium neglectum]
MALRQAARYVVPLGVAAGAAYFAAANQQQLAPFCAAADSQGPALDPSEWRPLKLVSKQKLTHNSFQLKFALPDSQQEVGLPVASCLLVKAPIQGPGDEKPKVVIRPYTPISPPDAKGYLELAIKAYSEGKMSKHLGSLQARDRCGADAFCFVGDTLDFKG